jgi:GNAT superfamily N-acetyltransferase
MTRLTATDVAAVEIVESPGDQQSIREFAGFLVDSFWLGSPRQMVPPPSSSAEDTGSVVSDSVKASLVEEQAEDLMNNYGERMGKRLLDSALLAAKDPVSGVMLGCVALNVLLLDRNKENILAPDESESILTAAVASLGPKERRQYKGAAAKEIADQLLGGQEPRKQQEAVVCFSNLSVAPAARGRGIAYQLCKRVERMARQWGYDKVYLKVESDNVPAKTLYEKKLGYTTEYVLEADPAIRLDTVAGEFIEIQCETFIMKKDL